MPSIKLGKSLVAGLVATREFVANHGGTTTYLDTVLTKIETAEAASAIKSEVLSAKAVTAKEAEAILVRALGPRATLKIGTVLYIRFSNQVKRQAITPDQWTALCEWVGRQSWLKGTKTILDIATLAPRFLATALKEKQAATAPTGILLTEDD